mmetsp:Transcript_1247/g.3289  ORF Transcript_1247/g.3289 Transcript_1247/m.3289 type:complete len:226 (-) Transcript_1247:747-1424(-)
MRSAALPTSRSADAASASSDLVSARSSAASTATAPACSVSPQSPSPTSLSHSLSCALQAFRRAHTQRMARSSVAGSVARPCGALSPVVTIVTAGTGARFAMRTPEACGQAGARVSASRRAVLSVVSFMTESERPAMSNEDMKVPEKTRTTRTPQRASRCSMARRAATASSMCVVAPRLLTKRQTGSPGTTERKPWPGASERICSSSASTSESTLSRWTVRAPGSP